MTPDNMTPTTLRTQELFPHNRLTRSRDRDRLDDQAEADAIRQRVERMKKDQARRVHEFRHGPEQRQRGDGRDDERDRERHMSVDRRIWRETERERPRGSNQREQEDLDREYAEQLGREEELRTTDHDRGMAAGRQEPGERALEGEWAAWEERDWGRPEPVRSAAEQASESARLQGKATLAHMKEAWSHTPLSTFPAHAAVQIPPDPVIMNLRDNPNIEVDLALFHPVNWAAAVTIVGKATSDKSTARSLMALSSPALLGAMLQPLRDFQAFWTALLCYKNALTLIDDMLGEAMAIHMQHVADVYNTVPMDLNRATTAKERDLLPYRAYHKSQMRAWFLNCTYDIRVFNATAISLLALSRAEERDQSEGISTSNAKSGGDNKTTGEASPKKARAHGGAEGDKSEDFTKNCNFWNAGSCRYKNSNLPGDMCSRPHKCNQCGQAHTAADAHPT